MLSSCLTYMNQKQLIEVLEDLGLSANEARVYLAGISLGPTTVDLISKNSDVKRTTVYPVIEQLKKKGLVSVHMQGFKKLYHTEKPEKLESILELRRAKFQKHLPDLNSLYKIENGAGVIGYHEGKDAIKNLYWSLLDTLKPGDFYDVISLGKSSFETFKDWFPEFVSARAKLNLHVKVLYPDVPWAREHKRLEALHKISVRWLPSGVKFVSNLTITPNRAFIHNFDDPMIGIVIENKNTIQVFQQMFEVMWSAGLES